MRIYLQSLSQDQGVPRFYQLSVQRDMIAGWTLIKESGRQGSKGRISKEHFASWEEAERAMLKHRDKQLAKGYSVVFIQGHELPDDKEL